MSTENVIRWSGAVAIVGGLFTVIGAFVPEPFAGQYLLSSLLTLLAVVGILLVVWRQGAGRWGLLGIVGVLAGTLLFATGISYIVAGISYAVGLILLAAGAWKSGVFPRWVPVLWVLAPLIGVPGIVLVGWDAPLITLARAIFGLSFIGAGYALWTTAPASPAATST